MDAGILKLNLLLKGVQVDSIISLLVNDNGIVTVFSFI